MLPETCSGGGPVIALPLEIAALWRGIDPPDGADVPEGWSWGDGGDVRCDYDRACEDGRDAIATEYGGLAWLPVGDGTALVLDGELMTAILSTDDGAVILRNYEEGELEADAARRYLELVAEGDWKPLPRDIELRDGHLVVFDSAYAGASDPDDIAADDGVAVAAVEPGTYAVQVATVDGAVDLIRLRRR